MLWRLGLISWRAQEHPHRWPWQPPWTTRMVYRGRQSILWELLPVSFPRYPSCKMVFLECLCVKEDSLRQFIFLSLWWREKFQLLSEKRKKEAFGEEENDFITVLTASSGEKIKTFGAAWGMFWGSNSPGHRIRSKILGHCQILVPGLI